jgi:hypothetical protein
MSCDVFSILISHQIRIGAVLSRWQAVKWNVQRVESWEGEWVMEVAKLNEWLKLPSSMNDWSYQVQWMIEVEKVNGGYEMLGRMIEMDGWEKKMYQGSWNKMNMQKEIRKEINWFSNTRFQNEDCGCKPQLCAAKVWVNAELL